MKVIFLDIDGVLLAGRHLCSSSGLRVLLTGRHFKAAIGLENPYNPSGPPALAPHALPEDTCAILADTLTQTRARVVISSSWRLDPKCPEHLATAGITELHPDWRTDGLWHGDGGPERGRQIRRWLRAHPNVSDYAILDDSTDLLPEQFARFVKTSFRTGLRTEHKRRLIRLLCPVEHRNHLNFLPASMAPSTA